MSLINSTGFITSRSCFIQYRDENITILNGTLTSLLLETKPKITHLVMPFMLLHFTHVKSSSVVATPNQPKFTLLNVSEVFTNAIQGIRFDSNQTLQPQIATDGAQLHQSKLSPLLIIPGEKYKHGVTITDDLDLKTFRASINRNSVDIELDPAFSSFVGDKIKLGGRPDQNSSLYLQTVSPRQSYIKLEVKLIGCPQGFRLSNKSQCMCNVDSYVGLVKCVLDNFYSHLLPGFWAGLLTNESELVTSPCPFCDYSSSASSTTEFEVILPRNYSELDQTVCGDTRTGVVCGMCRDNYTVHFHSPGFLCKLAEPVGCKLGWLFYLLSDNIVPVTAVFITVLALNISFTSGTVNGFANYWAHWA